LVIPHYVVLAFLWAAFIVLSAAAMVAIVVTGRYPRAIFEFDVGVLRRPLAHGEKGLEVSGDEGPG
jgi:hypothetical protein